MPQEYEELRQHSLFDGPFFRRLQTEIGREFGWLGPPAILSLFPSRDAITGALSGTSIRLPLLPGIVTGMSPNELVAILRSACGSGRTTLDESINALRLAIGVHEAVHQLDHSMNLVQPLFARWTGTPAGNQLSDNERTILRTALGETMADCASAWFILNRYGDQPGVVDVLRNLAQWRLGTTRDSAHNTGVALNSIIEEWERRGSPINRTLPLRTAMTETERIMETNRDTILTQIAVQNPSSEGLQRMVGMTQEQLTQLRDRQRQEARTHLCPAG